MPTVYIDLLLALNWFIDFLLLSATACWRRLPHPRGRLVLASAVGAASALIVLLPALPSILLLLYEIALAGIMSAIAFGFRGRRAYLQTVGVLFLLSALFGGTCYLLWLWFAPMGFTVINGVVYYNVSPTALLIAIALSYAAVRLYDRVARRAPPPAQLYLLTVRHGERAVTLTALHDTGHRVHEYFSGNPVIIAKKTAVEALLPPDFERALDNDGAYAARFRLIPYRSVGGGGVLPAFCPEYILATNEKGTQKPLDGAYIALTDNLERGEVDALLGDDIAQLFL